MFLDNRIGKFFVDRELVDKNFYKVLNGLNFIPLSVNFLTYLNGFEYMGHSPQFDVIQDGEFIPVYDITCRRNKHEEITTVLAKRDDGRARLEKPKYIKPHGWYVAGRYDAAKIGFNGYLQNDLTIGCSARYWRTKKEAQDAIKEYCKINPSSLLSPL